METSVSDVSEALFGSASRALRCPGVLAFTLHSGKGDVTDNPGSGSESLLSFREQKSWFQAALSVNKAVVCRFPSRGTWKVAAGGVCGSYRCCHLARGSDGVMKAPSVLLDSLWRELLRVIPAP